MYYALLLERYSFRSAEQSDGSAGQVPVECNKITASKLGDVIDAGAFITTRGFEDCYGQFS